ncbi:hypothetical protein [Bradyrhizobium sp. RP6]|uniref:hypothetical protein n=2 Tax=Bradyrhizobium TaxID=374 RepID=UPI000F51BDBF|nr:hypothetical protein [Bradyrhizobium sp. RP6]RQH16419.1 hypothetical protein EHH60_04390 [Bradyrhizobium sp. RP6]
MASSYRARPGPASRTGSLPASWYVTRKCLAGRVGHGWFVSSPGSHETKRSENETISRIGEDVRKLAMVTHPVNE